MSAIVPQEEGVLTRSFTRGYLKGSIVVELTARGAPVDVDFVAENDPEINGYLYAIGRLITRALRRGENLPNLIEPLAQKGVDTRDLVSYLMRELLIMTTPK